MDVYEKCVELLQFPFFPDDWGGACFIDRDNTIKTFKPAAAFPNSGMKTIQKTGSGKFCRWMLTNESIVIRFLDGGYWIKERPSDLVDGANNYARIFGIQLENADALIVGCKSGVIVLIAENGSVKERKYALDGHAFCGKTFGGLELVLFGQSRRVDLTKGGEPLQMQLDRDGARLQRLHFDVPLQLEGVVASLGEKWLICSQFNPQLGWEDDGLEEEPLSYDHDSFWIVPQDAAGTATSRQSTKIEDVYFVGAGGSDGNACAFFKCLSRKPQSLFAHLICVAEDGVSRNVPIKGLTVESRVDFVQYDPSIGWVGVSSEFEDPYNTWLIRSQDGLDWIAERIPRHIKG